jgi:hypothetical protein
MGFIKRSDGDTDHVVDRVFENVGEMLDVIAEHAVPDEQTVVVAVPDVEPASDEKAN